MVDLTTSSMDISVEFQNPDTVSTVGSGVDSMSVQVNQDSFKSYFLTKDG